MVRLVKISNKEYIAYDADTKVNRAGTIEDVSGFMVESLGVTDDDIDKAIIDLCLKGHNVAEFGTNGKFLFSSKVGEVSAYDL